MKILLHTCCAACLIYPLERLKESGFEVKGYFYNPNIHSFGEYNNRKQAVINFNKTVPLDIEFPEYNPAEYFNEININETKPMRCIFCWGLRLKMTARAAKDNGFSHFSTTLLVSPYQDQELIKRLGSEIAHDVGINFYYEDFRNGFRKAHDSARALGLYSQKYCGCIYSEIECSKEKR